MIRFSYFDGSISFFTNYLVPYIHIIYSSPHFPTQFLAKKINGPLICDYFEGKTGKKNSKTQYKKEIGKFS